MGRADDLEIVVGAHIDNLGVATRYDEGEKGESGGFFGEEGELGSELEIVTGEDFSDSFESQLA